MITFYRKQGGQIDEQVYLSTKIKDKDWTDRNVIIDFGKQKVEKCVVEGQNKELDFFTLKDYYAKVYPQLIEQLEVEAPITLASQEKKRGR